MDTVRKTSKAPQGTWQMPFSYGRQAFQNQNEKWGQFLNVFHKKTELCSLNIILQQTFENKKLTK